MIRARDAGAMLALAFLASSCSTSRTLVVGTAGTGPNAKRLSERREKIEEYTTVDGRRHSFTGIVESEGDTLRFLRNAVAAERLTRGDPGESRAVPRDSVASVQALRTNVLETGVLIAVFGAVIGGLLWGAGFAGFPD
jgi:hypothetical protein